MGIRDRGEEIGILNLFVIRRFCREIVILSVRYIGVLLYCWWTFQVLSITGFSFAEGLTSASQTHFSQVSRLFNKSVMIFLVFLGIAIILQLSKFEILSDYSEFQILFRKFYDGTDYKNENTSDRKTRILSHANMRWTRFYHEKINSDLLEIFKSFKSVYVYIFMK